MVTREDVYVAYRIEKSKYLKKDYKEQKNLPKYLETIKKKSPDSYKALEYFTLLLNTKFQNINMNLYFSCGFEIFKGMFYPPHFNDERILKLYIRKDKERKRNYIFDKNDVLKGFIFIKQYLIEHNISLKEYCELKDGGIYKILQHYQLDAINSNILVFLIMKKYINLSELEPEYITYISTRYNEIILENTKNINFLIKCEELCQKII